MKPLPQIILGSSSRARQNFFSKFHLPIKIIPSGLNEREISLSNEPINYVSVLAKEKGRVLHEIYPNDLIFTADTIVYCDNEIFHKPSSLENAINMISSLLGKTHSVFTGISIYFKNKVLIDYQETKVTFRSIPKKIIEKNSKNFCSLKTCGGYDIGLNGHIMVKSISGCIYNIQGIPLHAVHNLFKQMDVNLWDYFVW